MKPEMRGELAVSEVSLDDFCRLQITFTDFGQNSGQVSLNLSRGRLSNSAHVSLLTVSPLKVVMPIYIIYAIIS